MKTGEDTDKRLFPLLNFQQSASMESIPWKMIERHARAAEYNHHQTLEQLAARGGLSLFELLAVLHGRTKLDRNYTFGEANEELVRLLREFEGVQYKAVVDLLLASARIVWENGGFSGASGNWPLVEAYGQLEKIEAFDPELYARITERLPKLEYTDEPCTLCNGKGKSPGKTVGQLEADGFRQGKDMAEFIYGRQLSGVRTFLKEVRSSIAVPPDIRDLISAQLSKLTDDPPNPCKCPQIQAKDPRRHFKGCPERKPLDKETIEKLETAPAVHCGERDGGCSRNKNCMCACNGCTGMRIAKTEQELDEGKSKPLDEVFPPKEHPTKPEGPQQ